MQGARSGQLGGWVENAGHAKGPDQIEFVFFFSSRRRDTRWLSDWSSDVCSSDLVYAALLFGGGEPVQARQKIGREVQPESRGVHFLLGHGELPCPDVFTGVKLDLL